MINNNAEETMENAGTNVKVPAARNAPVANEQANPEKHPIMETHLVLYNLFTFDPQYKLHYNCNLSWSHNQLLK